MARFLKDVIKPGRVHLPDGRVMDFTRQQMQALHSRAAEMAAAGLQIPLCWNHQDVGPMSAADILAARARNVFGYVASTERGKEDLLNTTLDIPDPDDAAQFAKTRWISPEVTWDHKDGTGRVWAGPSITHLAATARPVDPHQKPPVQLSQDAPSYSRRVRLSLEDIMADEEKPDSGGEAEGEGGGEIADLIDALREHGLNIPDHVSDMAHLITAVKSQGEAEEEGTDNPGDEYGAEITEAQAPVMMAMERRVLDFERSALKQRIEALFPARIDRPTRDKLLAEHGTVRMSLDRKKGVPRPTGLAAKVAAYEELPERKFKGGTVRLAQDTGGTREATGGPMSGEDDQKAIRAEAKKAAERMSRGA